MQGVALTDTYENIGKNLWPCYKKWLLPGEWRWGKGNQTEENPKLIIFPENNFRLYFGSYEQKREAHQSSGWWVAHFDEEPKNYIFEEVYRGTLDYGGKVFMSYTPLRGVTFVTEDILPKCQDPTESKYWAPQEPMSLLENPHVPQEEKDMWIDMLSEKSIKSRVYGYATVMEGLVYEDFSVATHVCEPFPIPADWRFYRGIDFGYIHPTVSLIMATDGYRLFVVDEYYQPQRLVEHHVEQMNRQHSSLVLKDTNMLPRLITVSDHDAQLRAEYEAKGIYSIPAQKERIAGCEVVRGLLKVHSSGEPRFKVFGNCKHTIKEFGLYALPGEDAKGKLKPGEKADDPVKEHDHCMDLIRYASVQEFGFVRQQIDSIVSISKSV